MAAQMKRMKCDFMVHGCRSSFRDWAAETGVEFDVWRTGRAQPSPALI